MRGYMHGARRWIEMDDVGLFAFDSTGPVEVTRSASEDELWDAWVRSILPLVVQERRTEVLHASAYACEDGTVVALAGRMMAGKSTLAAAVSHHADCEPIADDALPFAFHDGGAVARPLPFRVRLRSPAADVLGPPTERRSAGAQAPLRGVVILSGNWSDTVDVERIQPAGALGALMPHAYCFSLATSKERLVENYARLTEVVPVWRIAYPRRLDRLPEVVECLLALTS
jgi:hypothetical protein